MFSKPKKINTATTLLFNSINESQSFIISIDIPSGIYVNNGQIGETAIKANLTLSLHRYKACHWLLPGKEYCGKTIVLDIGFANI